MRTIWLPTVAKVRKILKTIYLLAVVLGQILIFDWQRKGNAGWNQ